MEKKKVNLIGRLTVKLSIWMIIIVLGISYILFQLETQATRQFYYEIYHNKMLITNEYTRRVMMKWLKVWGVDSKDSSPFSDLVSVALSHEITGTNNYYAGWNIYDDYICHGGNNPNFSSQVIIARDRNQGVFVLSNLAGSSATMIADGIYRILLGEKVKIGLQLDYIALADFFSIEVILLILYLLMLLWNIKSKKACIVSATVSVTLIAAAAFFPAVFHYPYRSMLVWLPITTCIAIGVTVASAVILIFSYLFRCLSRR